MPAYIPSPVIVVVVLVVAVEYPATMVVTGYDNWPATEEPNGYICELTVVGIEYDTC